MKLGTIGEDKKQRGGRNNGEDNSDNQGYRRKMKTRRERKE